MSIIALEHQSGLKYRSCPRRFNPVTSWLPEPQNTTIITFARTGKPARKLSALDRIRNLPDGDIVLSCFDYSPLFALLVWDIAHSLREGRTLFLDASDRAAELLSRSYYKNAFTETSDPTSGGVRSFLKKAALCIEAERGLDCWSFCIPTGDGNPASLNTCVERILELGIPEFEIILCGNPAPGFRYGSDVRIVGEDIMAPPLHITRKKNTLARAARYPNLCILHDRVLLPRNFYDAMNRLGDDYPFTGFQSFWFAGLGQTLPLRYSDFCVADSAASNLFSDMRPSRQDVPYFAGLELLTQHPERSDFGKEYLTGSLYICKRAVWDHAPQNEALYWQDYEDVEQGMFAARAGIPSRLNPYSFTRTLSCRTVMHPFGWLTCKSRSGARTSERPWGCLLFPRRSHIQLTEKQASDRMREFATRYSVDPRIADELSGGISGVRRYFLIARLLWAARGDTATLLSDWYHLILCEPPVPMEASALDAVLKGPKAPEEKKMAWLCHPTLMRQVFNNPFSSPFIAETPVARVGIGLRFGSFVSALWFSFGSRHVQFRLSFWSIWRELIKSAPTSGGSARDAE